MTLRSSAGRRAWSTVTDQSLSSITNIAISVVVARSSSTREFGIFTAVFLLYVLALGAARALTSEPLTVRFSGVGDATQRRAAGEATGTTLVLGGAFSLCLVAIAAVAPDEAAAMVLALAVVLPGLLVQDTLRFVAFVAGRPMDAAFNDAVWLVCAAVGVTSISVSSTPGPWILLFVWGCAANVAALISAWRLRIQLRPLKSKAWLTTHRTLGPRYLAEFMAVQAGGQITVYLVGLVAGVRALAALRGAQLLFGPFHVVDSGLRQLSLAQLAALHRTPGPAFQRMLLLASAGLALLAAATAPVMLSLPAGMGHAILGQTWIDAQPVMTPLVIQKVALGLSAGAFCGLRILGAARHGLRARIRTSLLAALCGGLGAVVNGAVGAAAGMAVGQAIGVALYWRAYRDSVRDDVNRSSLTGVTPDIRSHVSASSSMPSSVGST
jgi:hypothetical protein